VLPPLAGRIGYVTFGCSPVKLLRKAVILSTSSSFNLMGLLETEWVKTRVFSQVDAGFKGYLVNIALTSSWHVERMPKSTKTKRLRDSYRFAGFHPALTVGGLFGDPYARVIRLTRRSKKRHVGSVVGYRKGGMTANCAGSGIFLVEACASILSSISVGSTAGAAKG